MKKVISILLAFILIVGALPVLAQEVYGKVLVIEGVEKVEAGKYSKSNIEELVIKEGVKEIGQGAFAYCESLKKVTLPRSLEFIDHEAFMSCGSLEKVIFYNPETRLSGHVIKKGVRGDPYYFPSFAGTAPKEVYGYRGSTAQEQFTKAFVPIENVEAFSLSENDDTVTINSVSDKGITQLVVPFEINGKRVVLSEGAFGNLESLEFVYIEEGFEKLPKELFKNSVKLNDVVLPQSLTTIGEGVFKNCKALEEIDLKNTHTLEKAAFLGCEGLVKVTHNQSLLKIEEEAFKNCVNLTDINLKACEYLGRYCFENCMSLTKVDLLSLKDWDGIDNKTVIEGYVYSPFFNCDKLTEIRIRLPEKTEEKGYKAICMNSENIERVIYENFSPDLCNLDFAVMEFDEKGNITLCKIPENITIFATDERARAYADLISAEFTLIQNDGGALYGNNTEEGYTPTLFWQYDDGVLTISGRGNMPSYTKVIPAAMTSFTIDKEWKKYNEDIVKIVVEQGVLSVSGFYDCVNLKEAVIGDGVQIGGNTFSHLKKLEKVTLGKNVVVGRGAFLDTKEIESITISDGVTLDKEAFCGSESLSEVIISSENVSISATAFDQTPFGENKDIVIINNTLLWVKNAAKMESYIVPENIKKLGGYLFYESKIKHITLPYGLEEIGKGTFEYSKLENVVLPESVLKIGQEAFAYASELKSINFPESIEMVGEYAFRNTKLKDVYVTNAMAKEGMFAYSEIEKVSFEDGVTIVPDYMFKRCNKLSTVNFPESITMIGKEAFSDCSVLESYPGGDCVTYFGDKAFSGCVKLSDVTIGENVTYVGEGLFENCSFERAYIKSPLTKIPHRLFKNCENLKYVTVPNTVTQIGDESFYWCALENIDLSKIEIIGSEVFVANQFRSLDINAVSIGERAFEGCDNLETINLSDNLTFVGESVFSGCNSLREIILPHSLSNLSESMFARCKSLEKITLPDNVTEIPYCFVNGCSNLKEVIYKGEGITRIGGLSFAWCDRFDSMELLDNVEHLGNWAFRGTPFYENKENWENNLLYYKDILVDFNKDSGENVIVKEGTKILAEGIFSNGDMTEVILPYSLKEIPKDAFYGCRKLVRVTAEVERVGENAFKYCKKLDEETKARFNITKE